MRLGTRTLAGVAAVVAATSGPASANNDPAYDRAVAAVQERIAAIDAQEGYIPGRAVVMVKAGGVDHVDASGVTRIENGLAVTSDTPFYIASMTKAFVGLMAVQLDADGTMSLDTTLAEIFPDMKVEGVDLSSTTMRRLLTHQMGFSVDVLSLRTAYTDMVDVPDYPAIVSAAGIQIDEDFRYSNQGYLLYAAALEAKTGRSWRAWIEDTLFDPLEMQHTSARTSDFAEVSHSHFRAGGMLTLYEPKEDEVMHAAGGLMISAADMSRWLAANVGEKSGIDASTFTDAQTHQVSLDMQHGPIHCSAYSFGWRQCNVHGLNFLEHGGSYTGMRSQMAILPEHGVGFAAMFNSDSMTGGLGGRLMLTFLSAYAGETEQLPPPGAFAEIYTKQVARLDAGRVEAANKERAKEEWGGWNWNPDIAELAEYTGTYSDAALGTLEIGLIDGTAKAWVNAMPAKLEPAQRDVFGAVLATDYEVEKLAFQRDAEGKIEAANFLGRRLVRKGR